MAFDVGRATSPVGLFLQDNSVVGGSDVVVGALELEAFEDPNIPEKGGLPPLPTGGVDFFSNR